jgi:hypothetical protein
MRYASRFLLFWVDKGGDGPDHCLEKSGQVKALFHHAGRPLEEREPDCPSCFEHCWTSPQK